MKNSIWEFNGLWNEEYSRDWFADSVLKTEDTELRTRSEGME
jgi:hypothetical protein